MKKIIYLTLLTFSIFIFFGIVYPLTVTFLAQVIAPEKANGSLLYDDGEIIGATYVGQDFNNTMYFYSRSSLYYYAGNSGFDSQSWMQNSENGSNFMNSYSGSNLEPYILYENASAQVERVSQMTNLSQETLINLINKNSSYNGFFKIVNTTTLNYDIYLLLN